MGFRSFMKNTANHTIDAHRDADALADLLSCGAVFPLVVTGSSMMPFLRSGRDTVLLHKTDRFYRGQIVLFRRKSGAFVLHRIRRICPDGRLLMNGDAQKWCEYIQRDQVLAEVISVSRNQRDLNPNSMLSRVLRALWYPTRVFRPFLWRMYGLFRKLTKPK